ncbi:unnamed protein product [Adineta ricciae]|uniref:Peptidase S1 domain-containing protein n=1 Tax=Adineta ricciae TaxID=249248 RepID=A0A813UC01_ADIRI|nr:unnamed protein product [Adineta ricciae]CAF0821271.1 unnamed protein product [Adineta ricciae]
MKSVVLFLIQSALFAIQFSTLSCVIYNCPADAPCGCSAKSAVVTKIINGEAAASLTWGWAASLSSISMNSHFCGGSIISKSHLLTAAHCTIKIRSPSQIQVSVGSIYSYAYAQRRTISKIYNHPSYSSATHENDIAILKLSSPLNLDEAGVDLICLPNVSSTILSTEEYPTVGTNLVAIGWGVLEENSPISSPTLQQVIIQSVASNSTYCQNSRLKDPKTQLCAGTMPEGGKDTCQGDSGGPLLMFTSNNVWEVIGITSTGYGCARANYPGIYTRVAAFQSWINETMNHANQIFTTTHVILILLTHLLIIMA